MLHVNIIGAGRLGQSLAWLLHQHQLASIQAVVCQSMARAEQAVAAIGAGSPLTLSHALPPSDITWLCTPDQQLGPVCQQLVANRQLRAGSLVIHSSGTLTANVLAPAATLGCATASIHPIYSFNTPQQTPPNLHGVYCGAEGDVAALARVTPLLTQLGAHVVPVDPQHKSLYHAAAVFASNFLPLLYQSAVTCFKAAALDADAAHHSTLGLMHSMLHNLATTQHAASALTGPVQRGDSKVVQAHWQALATHLPVLAPLYQTLSTATLSQVVNPQAQHAELQALFASLITESN